MKPNDQLKRETENRRWRDEEPARAQKIEVVSVLAGGLAHDLNNLLCVILGNIDIIKNDIVVGSTVWNGLREAEKAALRIKELVKRFYILSGGYEPVKNKGFITKLLKESAECAMSGSRSCCELSIADDLWPVEFDNHYMGQAIGNLILNADRAMPAGGEIKLKAENFIRPGDGKPEMLFLQDGKYIKISVQDQGAGISQEILPQIFDPYFSTREPGCREGTGLGLSTAYAIVRKHHGDITVDSRPGIGATFCIYLPA
jgi:two-component system cell cycle sensor histidine kinase/response regulator CckA